jgi:hypothetical protein
MRSEGKAGFKTARAPRPVAPQNSAATARIAWPNSACATISRTPVGHCRQPVCELDGDRTQPSEAMRVGEGSKAGFRLRFVYARGFRLATGSAKEPVGRRSIDACRSGERGRVRRWPPPSATRPNRPGDSCRGLRRPRWSRRGSDHFLSASSRLRSTAFWRRLLQRGSLRLLQRIAGACLVSALGAGRGFPVP